MSIPVLTGQVSGKMCICIVNDKDSSHGFDSLDESPCQDEYLMSFSWFPEIVSAL